MGTRARYYVQAPIASRAVAVFLSVGWIHACGGWIHKPGVSSQGCVVNQEYSIRNGITISLPNGSMSERKGRNGQGYHTVPHCTWGAVPASASL
eukprot:1178433-Prorocentrum_minimum.AAC.1